ncbi:MAG: YkoF family thiamine/hydroxymethylpyrimidine-binding protein [Planctomycetota bacterium]|nr:YkoF family thiamine/hydroxymethylpyrimidine-binding protein [Planctomycetota bacterium]
MTGIAAQVSLYPLGKEHLGPVIREAVSVFHAHGLAVRPGEMSTVISGAEEAVFAALREAFTTAAAGGPVVFTVTISNACPAPPPAQD